MVERSQRLFAAAELHFEEALTIKRKIDDRRGLASVLINLTLLRISQDRWEEVKSLTEEAAMLAEETQADEPLATAHMLLGLISHVQERDFRAAANHYAQAVVLAWEYNAVTGQRINRAIVRHLKDLVQHGKIKEARVICAHILQNGRQRLGDDYPSALEDFESLWSA